MFCAGRVSCFLASGRFYLVVIVLAGASALIAQPQRLIDLPVGAKTSVAVRDPFSDGTLTILVSKTKPNEASIFPCTFGFLPAQCKLLGIGSPRDAAMVLNQIHPGFPGVSPK